LVATRMVRVIAVVRPHRGRDRTRFRGTDLCATMRGVLDRHACDLRIT
jgi:hypothetical protein